MGYSRRRKFYFLGGVIIICALAVPGSISHGIPGTEGFADIPVEARVA
jgi:hypothetical protein